MPSFQSEFDEVQKVAVSVIVNRVAVDIIDTRQDRWCTSGVREFPGLAISLDPEGFGSHKRGRVEPFKVSFLGNNYMPVQYCNSMIPKKIYSYIRHQKNLVELCTPYVQVGNFL